MGISVPTTNLKKYTYIHLNLDPVLTVNAVHVHYLFLQDVILSDIDEIVHIIYHGAQAGVTSDMAIVLDRTNTIGQDVQVGGFHQWFGAIDVSAYTGIHELGLLWDISGPGNATIYHCYVWGKKGLV